MTNTTRLPADLAGALALIESLTVRRDAAEARAEKATGRIEGLVKENERFRHAAAETAAL